MATTRKNLALTETARRFLAAEFDAIARSSPSSLRRRSDRVAVTFRPCKQGRDAIPDRPIPIDDFRLLAASYRSIPDPRHGRCWRVTLGVYKATLDFPGTGRVVFRRERAHDVTASRSLVHPQPDHPLARTAVLLHQAIQDLEPGELATGLRLPSFSFGFEGPDSPRFGPAARDAARDAERAIDGLRAWPAELFTRDGATNLAGRPARVFASFAGLKGRAIRNPAYAVLRDHGLLPAGVAYKGWLSSVSHQTRLGRVFQDPQDRATEAARLRAAIQDHLFAEPAREQRLLADLAQACHAIGMKLGHGPEAIDALAGLLDNAWSRPIVPHAAAVQVLKLAGPPGPATLAFSDGAADADLADLGPERERARPTSSRRRGR